MLRQFVVGMMLMQMPATDSFWLLVATIENYLRGYYTQDLNQLRIDAMVFEKLLAVYNPRLSRHLVSVSRGYWVHALLQVENDVFPLIYMTNWFLTIFTMTLPWPSVLRVWDMFYCEGRLGSFGIFDSSGIYRSPCIVSRT